ncbi:MAG TPA: cation:proton antiporter [Hypericibacter adhaerens]|uniref:cation:proton antiporter domain-containing protein n=1 Tax=Hypericibacter adhaerens TaxID=2602016 RepID=UPI002CCE2B65|nr:cation:proton antiporter [Hypericibacter adhaerens]HWA46435.1 cation:proton antiporter [Hypericibacter adhaerens]
MHDEALLIATVAMAFVLAFGLGFLAYHLRLPPLVGYLLAGVALGPFTPGFVADSGMAGQLAEMGVILLMFGVGLHFSAADLMAVRWIAVPGAIGQILLATLLGTGMAMAWGWSLGAGIVLGLCLSVASTVVLLRALEDRNQVTSANGRIAVGWLIVEDLAMVLALVLLPAFAELLGGQAGEHAAEGNLLVNLLITLGKVAAFVTVAILLGPKLVPWLLKQVARTGSRELFTLSVLAVALGIAYGSAKLFGVSFALGAFFAGVVLSESHFSHRAAADSLPLQDAFAILFFVSVGMLFDPSILIREPLAVLAVLLLIIIGKSILAFLIVIIMGYPKSTALTVSASLAQIGEFSFILAGLGVSMGLMPGEGRDLILAGALLSITLNPLAFGAVDRLLAWMRRGTYGEKRLARLQGQLAELRKRTEAREAEHGLQLKNLVELFPIFADLDAQAREDLLLLFRPRTAAPGERIIRKGDRPDAAYFISKGGVQVSVGGREIPLGPGEFFGEMALLSGARRSADVTATDYCQLLMLDQREFRTFVARHPRLREHLDELAAQRSAMNRDGAEPNSVPAA